jgi:hypothetical protein
MATYNKFNCFTEDLSKGLHQLHAAGHTLKVYLSNATPDASADLIKTDLAEISAGAGYSAGGPDIENDLSRSGGTTTITVVDKVITASSGSIGPFRYAVVYNDSVTDDPLIAWYDYGSSITLADGESLNVDFTGNKLFDLA